MRIAKLLLSAALAALLTVAVTACGSSGGDSSGGGSDYSVGMILPGPINDKGFNETGYNGLQACGEAGAQINYEELVPVPQYERTYETLSQNENMVIGHGFEFGEIAAKVAPNYPDVDYVVTSNPLQPEQDNVQHLMPNSTQGAYLAGVAAGDGDRDQQARWNLRIRLSGARGTGEGIRSRSEDGQSQGLIRAGLSRYVR